MNGLILCHEKEASKPYRFELTKMEVNSIEELYYYCYYYYETVIEDFPKSDLLSWMENELSLTNMVNELKKMVNDKFESKDMLLNFLEIGYYFSDEELDSITTTINEYSNMPEEKKLEKSAKMYIKNGRFQKALYILEEVVKINPSPEVYHNLGVVYINILKPKTAERCFEKALELGDNKETVRQYFACLLQTKNLNTFEKKINQYLQSDDTKIRLLYGKFLELRGKTEQAWETYYKILYKNDIDTQIYEDIVIIGTKLNKIDEVNNLLEDLEENDIELYLINLALYYEMNNELEKALETLKELYTLNPNNIKCNIKISKLYAKLNNVDKALEIIYKAYRHDKTNEEIKILIANLNKKKGNVKQFNNIVYGLINEWKDNFRLQA